MRSPQGQKSKGQLRSRGCDVCCRRGYACRYDCLDFRLLLKCDVCDADSRCQVRLREARRTPGRSWLCRVGHPTTTFIINLPPTSSSSSSLSSRRCIRGVLYLHRSLATQMTAYDNKKHLKNVGPIRHCEPPHAACSNFTLPFTRCRYCRHHHQDEPKPAIERRRRATVATPGEWQYKIDVHIDNNNDNA